MPLLTSTPWVLGTSINPSILRNVRLECKMLDNLLCYLNHELPPGNKHFCKHMIYIALHGKIMKMKFSNLHSEQYRSGNYYCVKTSILNRAIYRRRECDEHFVHENFTFDGKEYENDQCTNQWWKHVDGSTDPAGLRLVVAIPTTTPVGEAVNRGNDGRGSQPRSRPTRPQRDEPRWIR